VSSRASSRSVIAASRCKQGGGGEADGGAGPGVEHERVPLSSPPVAPSSLQRLAFSFFLAMNPLVTGLSPFVGDGGFWVHGFRDVSNGLALLRNEARTELAVVRTPQTDDYYSLMLSRDQIEQYCDRVTRRRVTTAQKHTGSLPHPPGPKCRGGPTESGGYPRSARYCATSGASGHL
jgi:hypothetical protein